MLVLFRTSLVPVGTGFCEEPRWSLEEPVWSLLGPGWLIEEPEELKLKDVKGTGSVCAKEEVKYFDTPGLATEAYDKPDDVLPSTIFRASFCIIKTRSAP